MNKESLIKARELISKELLKSDILEPDMLELVMNLSRVLEPGEYENNIKVLSKVRTERGVRYGRQY